MPRVRSVANALFRWQLASMYQECFYRGMSKYFFDPLWSPYLQGSEGMRASIGVVQLTEPSLISAYVP